MLPMFMCMFQPSRDPQIFIIQFHIFFLNLLNIIIIFWSTSSKKFLQITSLNIKQVFTVFKRVWFLASSSLFLNWIFFILLSNASFYSIGDLLLGFKEGTETGQFWSIWRKIWWPDCIESIKLSEQRNNNYYIQYYA